MEELTKHYSEAAQHLHDLPPHITDELGAKAVSLTHEDQHPKKEGQGDYGRTVLQADFEYVITDPEFDSSDLEEDAIAAAEAGKQKLSAILEQSAKYLRNGHQKLQESGYAFGPNDIEADEERDAREKAERDAVYDSALESALLEALAAHGEGNFDQSTGSLESLILLRQMKLSSAAYEDRDDRSIFRKAVHAGLAQDLLAAAQNTSKIYQDKGHGSVASSLYGLQSLLAFALGRSLGHRFEDEGREPSTDDIPSDEIIRDIFAALTTPNAWLTLDKVKSGWRGSTKMEDILARLNPDIADGVDSLKYYAELVDGNSLEKLKKALECTDPQLVFQASKKLGIPEYAVVTIFGETVEWGELIPLKKDYIEQMRVLSEKYPEYFKALVASTQFQYSKLLYEPSLIGKGIEAFQAVGIDDPELIRSLVNTHGFEELQEQCIALMEACKAQGVTYEQLKTMTNLQGNHMIMAIHESSRSGSLAEYVSDLVCRSCVTDIFRKKLQQLSYPIKRGFSESTKLLPAELHLFTERITKTGIPADVAEKMIESWAT
jgi:hypothetical protein